MADFHQINISNKFIFIGFDGHYGGDEYERLLYTDIKKKYSHLNAKRISTPRKGGIKSLPGFFRIWFLGFFTKGVVVRPFGIPIFRKNMTIIFHHYDQTGSPLYTKILERIDFYLLKIFSKVLQIKVITVSEYWSNWIMDKFDIKSFIKYNEINTQVDSIVDRKYLSEKYNLRYDSEWFFLGSNQPKKGGYMLLKCLEWSDTSKMANVQIIQTGPIMGDLNDLSVVRWLESDDYFSFIKNCSAVIANSQFDEGWCRIIHEAALLGVPVAGSGRGGMAELLRLVNCQSTYTVEELCAIITSDSSRITPNTDELKKLTQVSDSNVRSWLNEYFHE